MKAIKSAGARRPAVGPFAHRDRTQGRVDDAQSPPERQFGGRRRSGNRRKLWFNTLPAGSGLAPRRAAPCSALSSPA
jgi:hypothetical protein